MVPSLNRIRPEHLKNLPPVFINTLARLFTRYLSECKIPKQWKTSEAVWLNKKGDPHDIGNYSLIVLIFIANIDSFERLTTRIGRLRMRRCGPTPALTIFVAYAPTSSHEEEEVEAFYMDLEKFYREDHAFYKDINGDFNAKVGPR
ncbi:hypothetical protein RB195_024863 [Necator americanus]